jgi:hypothetical protein
MAIASLIRISPTDKRFCIGRLLSVLIGFSRDQVYPDFPDLNSVFRLSGFSLLQRDSALDSFVFLMY